MGIDIFVVRDLFEPLPKEGGSYTLREATQFVLWRQPESRFARGIDPVGLTVFNRNQVNRLLQEFRFLAKQSDDVTRRDLDDAASFIEREVEAIGVGRLDCYLVFQGD